MTVYEALNLMLTFGLLMIGLITLVVLISEKMQIKK